LVHQIRLNIGFDFMPGLFKSWVKALVEKEPPEPENPVGKIVIGTLSPDIIDTAKEMVRKSLKAAQFQTIDVGVGASVAAFLSKIKEVNADIVVVTVSVAAAKTNLVDLVSALEAEGLRGKVAVLVGGASVTKEDADSVGALYGKTREDAVRLAQEVMAQKTPEK
jgi:5-methyltetrahydrofolate--homocysteine methyltransferase